MTGRAGDSPRITVDDASGVAPFEQVRDQFAELIASGALVEGDRLPTVRGLAAELQLAAGTVARAYKELEAEGLVATRSRAGTVVAPHAQSVDIALRRSARELAERAVDAGVDDGEALAILAEALREARRFAPDHRRNARLRGPRGTAPHAGTSFWSSRHSASMLSESSTDPSCCSLAARDRSFGPHRLAAQDPALSRR